MSEFAIRVFSQSSDILTEKISAFDIKSHEDAREKGPFCDSDHKLMYWKNWGRRSDGVIIKKHFSHYRNINRSINNFNELLDEQKNEIIKSKNESPHNKFQNILLDILLKKISFKESIIWCFKDSESSDFLLKGDLLSNATCAVKEYRIYPPFINYYDLDLAILGNDNSGNTIILAGIEIEYSNKAELLKTLLCKSLGFPLLTINIENVNYDDITEEFCLNRLTETKISSKDKIRRNYIYLHPLLYPVYLFGYIDWGNKINNKHQYIIFPKFDEKDKLKNSILNLIEKHNVNKDVFCQPVNLKSTDKGSVTQFENETALFKNYIDGYCNDYFLRLQATRPEQPIGNIFKFHLELAQILALKYDCLVSYKYAKGHSNWNHDEQFWYLDKYTPPVQNRGNGKLERKKLCFKRLSIPIQLIMKFLPKN